MRSPEPLTWRQVAPALPKAGHGARIVASEISEGWMRDVFDDPLHSLLPRSAWPKCAGAAKMWVQDEAEWVKIIRGMAANKLVDFLRPGERFFWSGSPLGTGKFRRDQKEQKDPKRALRAENVICNAIPSNEFFRSQADDIGMLPYFGQLQGVELQCDVGSEDSPRVCLWAEEDMVSSFDLFRKGRTWLPFQAFSKGVPGDAVTDFQPDLRSELVVYPAMTVIMMGQKNATEELQYLLLDPPPYGAGVPHHQETR